MSQLFLDVMEVKPIGVFHMADDKDDEKSNLCTGI
jgi:inorganic pyrophosphatase